MTQFGTPPPAGAPPVGTPGTIKDPVMTIVLMLVTCGLYGLYWLYITSKEMQQFTGKYSVQPEIEVILCLVTGGLYHLYWYYKSFSMIPGMQEQVGRPVVDNTVLWFVLMFVPLAGIYALYSFQSELNEIYKAAGATA